MAFRRRGQPSRTDFRILPEAARVVPEWAVIERIWTELRTPYDPDDRLYQLTAGQRAVYALSWIRSEVCNGGFDQCFFNSTGYLLPEAIEGADLLEAPQWASMLREARDVFPPPFPRDRTVRQELLDELPPDRQDALDRLDDRLYDLDGASETSLDLLFRRYINGHPEEFFVPAANEEEAASALLQGARSIINSHPPRRLELAQALLEEVARRSRAGGTGRAGALAESLLAQLPDMTA
jgi:hypothetical protein